MSLEVIYCTSLSQADGFAALFENVSLFGQAVSTMKSVSFDRRFRSVCHIFFILFRCLLAFARTGRTLIDRVNRHFRKFLLIRSTLFDLSGAQKNVQR